MKGGLLDKHNELIEIYDKIYKKAKEVYDETAHGGYLINQKIYKRDPQESICPVTEKRVPISEETKLQIAADKKNIGFNNTKRS